MPGGYGTERGSGYHITEIIAKLCVRKAHIIERPVDHFPRLHGEQTGAKLSVIIRSLIWLLALSVEITAERISRRWSPQWRLPVRHIRKGLSPLRWIEAALNG